jgi:hypothetical protein
VDSCTQLDGQQKNLKFFNILAFPLGKIYSGHRLQVYSTEAKHESNPELKLKNSVVSLQRPKGRTNLGESAEKKIYFD